MSNASIEKLMDRLAEDIPTGLRDAGEQINSCILATRMATGVLAGTGIRARPLACRVDAMNKSYLDVLTSGAKPDVKNCPDGWTVVIGDPNCDDGGYNAHVVAIVKERYLLDLTINQVTRPHKNIRAIPFWTSVTKEFLKGEESLGVSDEDTGSLVLYKALPEEKGYLTAPAWRDFRVNVTDGHAVLERFRPKKEACA